MAETKYSMSFTTGGLLFQESVTLAELYSELGDWNSVQSKALETNALQHRTISSSKRTCREITGRLKTLTPDELQLLTTGTRQEQIHILWLAICKRYRFLHDFAVEIVREKFLSFNHSLTRDDYDSFFNTKAEWHEELNALTEATRNKLRQIAMKMLREVGIISKSNTINPALLSPRFVNVILRDSREFLAVFPVSDSDIKNVL